jgi:hypothetical protein
MRLSRDSLAALLAFVAFVVVTVLGIYKMHGPGTQRLLRADGRRVQNLRQLADEINGQFRVGKQLPSALSDEQKSKSKDPVSGQVPDYLLKSSTRYALCATFALASPAEESNSSPGFWMHPPGQKCFEFEASANVPPAPYDYLY